MKSKIVIYTAIIGGSYDSLRQPLSIIPDVDYICFVKKGSGLSERNGHWIIREVDYENSDNTRIARYVKLHPHLLLKDYEYSVWIDGNIQIASQDFYSVVEKKIEEGVLLSSLSHPHVECCYDDAYICIAAKKDKTWKIIMQILYLKFHGFPKNFGMYETNVFYRNHSSEKVIEFNNLWWHLLTNMSRRDQLGCTYSMWKTGISIDYLLPKGQNARNSPLLNYYPHKHVNKTYKKSSKGKKIIYKFIKKILGYRSSKKR